MGGNSPEQVLVAGGVEAVHTAGHHGNGGQPGSPAAERPTVSMGINAIGASGDHRVATLRQAKREVSRNGRAVARTVPGSDQGNGSHQGRQRLFLAPPPETERFLESKVLQLLRP
ncbi:hypothetical protein AYX22_12705 [Arthrobacter sp. D5-1]|nr:hypothetical protein AYX22_12705 [Arthrobacter sp. D5-1]